jgi:hypothetical protein
VYLEGVAYRFGTPGAEHRFRQGQLLLLERSDNDRSGTADFDLALGSFPTSFLAHL